MPTAKQAHLPTKTANANGATANANASATESKPRSTSPTEMIAIITACHAAATGFEMCARKTRDEAISVAATREAGSLRLVADEIIAAAAALDVDARPKRARTCERLRWEWLASTAMVMDGRSDARLLIECARILEEQLSLVASSASSFPNVVVARLRVAATTAASLALSPWDTMLSHAGDRFAVALAIG